MSAPPARPPGAQVHDQWWVTALSLVPTAAMMQVLDKKTVHRLGSELNHAAASKPSAYAVKLMEKMGWKEGQGLGKNADGMSTHVVIKKREDNVGIGLGKEAKSDQTGSQLSDHWWHQDFGAQLKAFKVTVQPEEKSSKKKDKKRKRGEEEEEKEEKEKKSKKDKKKDKKDKRKKVKGADDNEPMEGDGALNYQELFKATGGARLGMRARRDQRGKIMRTEGAQALIV